MVLINLKPFQVKRIPLKLSPEFILSFDNYFICANSLGKVLCLDLKGNLVSSFDLEKKNY